MGIFEFIKEGDLDSLDHEIEDSLKNTLRAADLDLKDLKLRVISGTALLSGIAGSLKDAEIARLMVGNHAGIDRVNDDGLIVVPAAQPAKMVTVRAGDTLSKIAKDQLGNANRDKEILEANKPMLKDPKEIFPGQVLRIPVDGLSVAH